MQLILESIKQDAPEWYGIQNLGKKINWNSNMQSIIHLNLMNNYSWIPSLQISQIPISMLIIKSQFQSKLLNKHYQKLSTTELKNNLSLWITPYLLIS